MAVFRTFRDWDEPVRCELCGLNQGLERHHKVYRSRQGSDAAENLIWLCKVCHGAAHGLVVTYQGHSCRTCQALTRFGCHFGEQLTGRPGPSGSPTPPPWDARLERAL